MKQEEKEEGWEQREEGEEETHLTTPTCDRRRSLVRLRLRRLCGAKMRRWFGAVVDA